MNVCPSSVYVYESGSWCCQIADNYDEKLGLVRPPGLRDSLVARMTEAGAPSGATIKELLEMGHDFVDSQIPTLIGDEHAYRNAQTQNVI